MRSILFTVYPLILISIILGYGCSAPDSKLETFSLLDMDPESDQMVLRDDPSSYLGTFDSQSALSLVEGNQWQPVAPSLDPFAHLIQDRIPCDWTSFGVEYGGIEVNTGRCGYITLTQNLKSSISPHTQLKISAWHTPLLKGDLQGEAFFSLMIGEHLIWEKELWIPSEAVSWEEIVPSSLEIPVGTPVFLNVRNHGANSWVFHLFQAWTPDEL